jgi:hypothetical protein
MTQLKIRDSNPVSSLKLKNPTPMSPMRMKHPVGVTIENLITDKSESILENDIKLLT